MNRFKYKAKKKDGTIISAFIEALNTEDAIDRICKFGYFPIHVQEQVNKGNSKGIRYYFESFFIRKKINVFASQLSELIKNGMPVLYSIDVIISQTDSSILVEVFNDLYVRIKDGESLSEALAFYPSFFDQFFISMIKVGEENGTLSEILKKIVITRKKQDSISSKMKSALVYPAVVAVVGIAAVVFMMTNVMPKLVTMLQSMNVELPMPTLVLISIVNWFESYFLFFLIFLVLLYFLCSSLVKRNREFVDKLKLNIPFIGNAILRSDLSGFCAALGTSLESGLQLIKALELSASIVSNRYLKGIIMKCHDKVINGQSLGQTMKETGVFPKIVTNMISVSEKSGSLSTTLLNIADNYEEEIDEFLKRVMTLIEPAIIVCLGIAVGFIVIALLLPVFSMDVLVQ